MLPIIVLIGRTNVGKSTLFNILSKTRNALVADYPCLTRDRNYAICQLKKNNKIIIVDTAGLNFKSKDIEKKSHEQTLEAIKESDGILFLVSARDGITSEEYEIAKNIRKYEKKIILIINKIDGIKENFKIHEFYCLGFKENVEISASHNQGINNLILKHLTPWINLKLKEKKTNTKNQKYLKKENISIKVTCIGKPNVGKSTLINSLLMKKRIITSEKPGTTIDSIATSVTYNYKNYIFTDTAGISKKKSPNKIEQLSKIKTFEAVKKSNIILLIIDAKNKISHQDLFLFHSVATLGKPLIIVFNKCDLLKISERENLKKIIKNKLKNYFFSKIHFISALKKKGIFEIFKSIDNTLESSKRKIYTSNLMKIMQTAIKKHQPAIINGRRIKLKYVHLGGYNPIKIVIHGNQIKYLSLCYKKYLKNFFSEQLKIKEIPIKIEFKETINPYISKK